MFCVYLVSVSNKRSVAALGATDCRLLELLQADARITNVALADAVNLSPAPCLRRVRDL